MFLMSHIWSRLLYSWLDNDSTKEEALLPPRVILKVFKTGLFSCTRSVIFCEMVPVKPIKWPLDVTRKKDSSLKEALESVRCHNYYIENKFTA